MKIKVLQHVPFEGPAAIAGWAVRRGHTLSIVHLYKGERLPQLNDFDMLCVMGGPMSVNDEDRFAFLAPEMALVREAATAGKAVLGVCLGAQLIAKAHGARAFPAPFKEIGWFEVYRTKEGAGLFTALPERFTPLHWHGETFDLPKGATLLARTEAAKTQAFCLGERVLGLQFHLEATPQSLEELVANASGDIGSGPFEQQAAQIVEQKDRCEVLKPLLDHLLDELRKNVNA